MKSILMSIQPKWVAKILNGEKTIEVRKRFPLNYRGWVYIYCTKDKKRKLRMLVAKSCGNGGYFDYEIANGKVVARFYCDNVEEIGYNYRSDFTSVYTDTLDTEDLEKLACLTKYEFAKYLQGNYGYAIHISQLEIFDKPKELSEFRKMVLLPHFYNGGKYQEEDWRPLTKAPQSYMHIEVVE